MPKQYYIAHTISTRHHIRDVVTPFLNARGIRLINPFYDASGQPRETRPDIKYLDEHGIQTYSMSTLAGIPLITPEEIVPGDLGFIERAAGVIWYLISSSIGSSMESFYNSYTLKKPLIVVTDKYQKHAWLIY